MLWCNILTQSITIRMLQKVLPAVASKCSIAGNYSMTYFTSLYLTLPLCCLNLIHRICNHVNLPCFTLSKLPYLTFYLALPFLNYSTRSYFALKTLSELPYLNLLCFTVNSDYVIRIYLTWSHLARSVQISLQPVLFQTMVDHTCGTT